MRGIIQPELWPVNIVYIKRMIPVSTRENNAAGIYFSVLKCKMFWHNKLVITSAKEVTGQPAFISVGKWAVWWRASPSEYLFFNLVWVNFIVLLNNFYFTVKEIPAGDDEEGTSGQPLSKRLKVEPEKKKEKRHKVDEDEIQKMQWVWCIPPHLSIYPRPCEHRLTVSLILEF